MEKTGLENSFILSKLNQFLFNFRREAIWVQEVRQTILTFGLLLATYEPPLQVLQTYATWYVRRNLWDVRYKWVRGYN